MDTQRRFLAITADLSFSNGSHAVCAGAPKNETKRNRFLIFGRRLSTVVFTGSEPGLEHQLTLHAWSRQGGHREAHVIAGVLLQALDDAPLALAGHRLVNFRFSTADVRRESDGRTYRALVRFRAVTEPE